jgi:hypothetical protein
VEKILTEDYGIRKGSAKITSQILSHDQKQHGLMSVLHTLSLSLSFSLSLVG